MQQSNMNCSLWDGKPQKTEPLQLCKLKRSFGCPLFYTVNNSNAQSEHEDGGLRKITVTLVAEGGEKKRKKLTFKIVSSKPDCFNTLVSFRERST